MERLPTADVSGNPLAVKAKNAATNGRLIRNTQCHVATAQIAPPTNGPATMLSVLRRFIPAITLALSSGR